MSSSSSTLLPSSSSGTPSASAHPVSSTSTNGMDHDDKQKIDRSNQKNHLNSSNIQDGQEEEDNDRDTAYFQYYALLSHQAQMLQDSVRTTAYQKAILGHGNQCFLDKYVIDVGAGNGILSIFSAQAGAKKVYAIEASNMVERLQHFINASKQPQFDGSTLNPWLADRIKPISSKMEDVTVQMLGDGVEKVDTIISECLGVLLVHERMCESFLDARDRFLKPGGSVLPSSGTICLAPIEDKVVWEEAANKARFWDNRNFYGVDVTPFSEAAWEESFSSPVVGCFGPLIVLTPSNDYQIDFQTISKENLKRFTIPLRFEMTQTAVVHGLGGWFDLHFLPFSSSSPMTGATFADGSDTANMIPDLEMSMNQSSDQPASKDATSLNMSTLSAIADLAALNGNVGETGLSDTTHLDPSISSTYMTTSPYATPTHWQQVRFLLREPLAVNKGQTLVGTMLCEVNQYRSYTLTANLHVQGSLDVHTQRTAQWRLDRQIYSWTSASPAPQ